MRSAGALVALLMTTACASGIEIPDVEIPRPVPTDSCLVIGFFGGRDAWDDESKGVRQLALELRSDGISTQTFENRRRDVALQVVRGAEAARLVVYGQSFGGAAVVKFARQLEELDVRIDATIQTRSARANRPPPRNECDLLGGPGSNPGQQAKCRRNVVATTRLRTARFRTPCCQPISRRRFRSRGDVCDVLVPCRGDWRTCQLARGWSDGTPCPSTRFQ